MEESCTELVKAQFDLFLKQFQLVEDGRECAIVTPLYLPDNTQLSVYLSRRQDGTIEVTDRGETLDWLYLSGMTLEFDDPRVTSVGRRFGLSVDGGELSQVLFSETVAPNENNSAIGDVIQSVLDLSYLVYTKQIRPQNSFGSTVADFLADGRLPFQRRAPVRGKTGERKFDFRVAAQQPILLDLISATNRTSAQDRAEKTIFKVIDTQNAGGEGARYVCVYDDTTPDRHDSVTSATIRSLKGYIDNVVAWSDQETLRNLLLDAA